MDASFPKRERLCLKRRFDALLAEGKSFYQFPFRVIWLLKDADPDGIPLQVAVSVRKKQFKLAVTRNLIKRRIRESWRRQKAPLQDGLAAESKSLYILLVYGASGVPVYRDLFSRTGEVIRKLRELTLIRPER